MPAAATIVGAVIAFAGTVISTGIQAATAVEDELGAADGSVEAMKKKYGNGVSTLITIANGTGGPMTIRDYADDSGHIWEYPYPNQIDPGQIGCFLHVHTAGTATGSVGAVQYYTTPPTATTEPGAATTNPFIFAWSTPYSSGNSVLIVDNSEYQAQWAYIFKGLPDTAATYNIISRGYSATASIGQGHSPICNFTLVYVA